MSMTDMDDVLATGGEEKHVFYALYRVGLLGYVYHDRIRGEWTQRFLRPGEATLEVDGVLPPSTHYVVHPVLSDVIGAMNTAYLRNIDRVNIAGYDRPWRDSQGLASNASPSTLFVLKGDVCGFGALMHAGADGPVRALSGTAQLKG